MRIIIGKILGDTLRLTLFVIAFGLASAQADASLSAAIANGLEGQDVVSGVPARFSILGEKNPTVVVFLSAHCPCSESHEPVLKKLATEFTDVRFVGVHSNADEEVQEATEHFKKSQLPFPVIRDAGAKWADAFGALKTPHVFVVSPSGDVLFKGGVDDSHVAAEAKKHFLRAALTDVREGRKPTVTEARSLGCTIKR